MKDAAPWGAAGSDPPGETAPGSVGLESRVGKWGKGKGCQEVETGQEERQEPTRPDGREADQLPHSLGLCSLLRSQVLHGPIETEPRSPGGCLTWTSGLWFSRSR